MFDINLITSQNGWAMSLVGATTVFTGLILLSFVVSQFYKLLLLWDNRDAILDRFKKQLKEKEPSDIKGKQKDLPEEVKSAARQCNLLIELIGEPFPLPRLLDLFTTTGFTRSHTMISEMLQYGLIVPDGKGYFLWDHAAFEKKVKKK